MFMKSVVIKNRTGLHARPCSEFVAKAKSFSSDITIKRAEKETGVNAKSMVLVMTQGFTMGTTVEISATGEDERQAVDALVNLIDAGFGELA